MAPTVIDIKKGVFSQAPPEIRSRKATMEGEDKLNIDPKTNDIQVNVRIQENHIIKSLAWGAPIATLVDALASLPRLDTLTLNVTWETRIRRVGEVRPYTIPADVVAMITQNFGQLRGVAHATVTGLGAGPGQELVDTVQQPASSGEERKKKAETPKNDKNRKKKTEASNSDKNRKRKSAETPEDDDTTGRHYNLRRRVR